MTRISTCITAALTFAAGIPPAAAHMGDHSHVPAEETASHFLTSADHISVVLLALGVLAAGVWAYKRTHR